MSAEANFSEQVAGIAPEVAAGYAQVRATIERDGALPASFKALVCAVCASVLDQAELAERELARGRALGLADREIGIAGVALLLSRGEVQTQRFIDLAGGLAPAPTPRPSFRSSAPRRISLTTSASMRCRRGWRSCSATCPRCSPATSGCITACSPPTRPPQASSEILLVGLNAAELQTRFIAIHAATARKAGATDEQLVESVVCAIPATGIAAWAAGAEGLFPDASNSRRGRQRVGIERLQQLQAGQAVGDVELGPSRLRDQKAVHGVELQPPSALQIAQHRRDHVG